MPIQDQDLGAVGGKAAEIEPDVYDLEDPETIAKLTHKLIKKNEKMRITKAGLLFSGPTAYISNMSYAPITIRDSPPHDSNEEAYQFRKATDHGCAGLAEAVLKTTLSEKGIQFIHINVRSIFRKLKQIEILYGLCDFLFCTETWLDNRFSDSMVKIKDMKVFRCDRESNGITYNIRTIGGGVCIYVRKKYMDFVTVYEPATKITPNFEILTLLVNKPNHRSMSLICIYKPPKGKVKDLIDFLKNVISLPAMRNREFWILGDLNVDWLKIWYIR